MIIDDVVERQNFLKIVPLVFRLGNLQQSGFHGTICAEICCSCDATHENRLAKTIIIKTDGH